MGTSNSKAVLLFYVAAIAINGGNEVVAKTPGLGSVHVPFVTKKGQCSTTSAATSNVRKTFLSLRAGETADATTTEVPEEVSLDDKVHAAMKKLGISPTGTQIEEEGENGTAEETKQQDDCENGVCPMPDAPTTTQESEITVAENIDPSEIAQSIAKDMDVDETLAMAAIGATSTFGEHNERIYNEQAAREMIQQELDMIGTIPADSENVQQLVGEGHDVFLSRRALAFADGNMDDARAILLADQLDAQEEEEAAAAAAREEEEARMKAREEVAAAQPDLVEVNTNFDPTAIPANAAAPPIKQQSAPPDGMPKPAAKSSVVFEATTAQIQELVLESPVPVLLDIHADWCGPCKVLGPILEEMAVKAGGVFRLVKVNSDNERPVSSALEVTALPTVFGVRDGKIVHMFQGMPRSEDMMKNFMMGLFGAAPFSPPVTADESKKYDELTSKLIKTAGSASFSFSARERLTDRLSARLDVMMADESVADVEGAATLIRKLLNNVVRNPYDDKYRKVNLKNKVINAKLGQSPACLSVLKMVGFAKSGSELTLAKGKKVINVAPLAVARDFIDKWIQKNRTEVAALARKRKDEMDRVQIQAELDAAEDEDDVEEDEPTTDPSACNLKLRLDGKKKIHDVTLHEDDTLGKVLEALEVPSSEDDVQITCVAKRLVVKSSDEEAMKKSLRQHGLMPGASLVVKVGSGGAETDTKSLKERAADKKSRKKGSHTMQSIGIYAKDDNNKAELIDGGGGVWYEHDVSDDEEEVETEEKKEDVEDVEKEDDDGEGADTQPDEEEIPEETNNEQ